MKIFNITSLSSYLHSPMPVPHVGPSITNTLGFYLSHGFIGRPDINQLPLITAKNKSVNV